LGRMGGDWKILGGMLLGVEGESKEGKGLNESAVKERKGQSNPGTESSTEHWFYGLGEASSKCIILSERRPEG